MDGFRSDETGSATFLLVAHQKRIAIREVRRDFTIIGDRNIWAVLSQLHVVPVVLESVRKQTDSLVLAARHGSKKHRQPPEK
jgi:hypothetical protein